MDKREEMIGNESGLFVTIREKNVKRKECEEIPKPVKQDKFSQWAEEKLKALKGEVNQIAVNLAGAAFHAVANVYSEKAMAASLDDVMTRETLKIITPVVMQTYVPLLKEELNNIAYRIELGEWQKRLTEIDGEIARLTARTPQPFSPEKINRDPRFPIDRVAQDKDGRWYDRWVTEGLKGKPVYFEPQKQYEDALCRYYHEVYWATAEKERNPIPVPVKVEVEVKPKPVSVDPGIPFSTLDNFYSDDGIKEPNTLQGRISRIYKRGSEKI